MLNAAVTEEGRFARTAHMKLSPIKEMELAASRIPGVVSLAQGIPSFDTPEPIKAFVQQKVAEGACAKYSLTPGLPQLRELIAESLLREGMHYDPESEIIVTCGSIEGIAATLLTLTQPGDEVILPTPSYASYQEVVRMAGCTPRFAVLREENNFAFDREAFERCLSARTRAILYCNPNNPTGTVFSRAETLALVELAERYGLFLVIDEAYKDFVYTKEPYYSPAQLAAVRSRVVRVFTFSKAYGMTGWRVGYLHSDARNTREILKVHDALVTCAPVVSQYAAVAALECGGAHIAAFRGAFKERRDRTLEHLDALSHVFDYQKPEGAYFVFPRVKDVVPWARDSRRLARRLLEEARVAVVPGVAFGPSGESHLRLNFGREPADIDAAFERLARYFGQRTPASVPVGTPAAPPVTPGVPAATEQSLGARRRLRRLAVPYLRALARVFLRRKKPLVIAIAGNRGKTVMKRLFGELLSARYKVRTNPRSYNTEIGLPLAVLNLEIETRSLWTILQTLARAAWTAFCSTERLEVLVLELGVRQRGDMHELLRTVRPDVAVLTTLTPSYSNDDGLLHALQDEMRVLCQAVGASCHFLVDDEDLLLNEAVRTLPVPPVPLRHARWSTNGRGLTLQSDGRVYHVTRELVGESERVSVQAAVLLAERWTDLTPAEIAHFLAGEEDQATTKPQDHPSTGSG
ncbi:MAG TPA: aminotransferase class I/II-fold pyridoxal phosphate-dependent enzyme [Candidatus Binatia bacterium]|nr:aminotransferase class I/II-fold pyridoxal phosphate-dependent enzyme [Candidatus Binatia bacterium]